ncbi:MAG: glycerol-3-phosphate 1-O-acyltransferase PlsY [Clostridia bacterium]|nr:glycerol-3-phosphate 1-O-acyltransferase PlsY [Clostridia bacterium]MBP3649866.1 glycerol-3-phosphate 1-O-acyltransferase PlsY [Clostridia bacterium]
MREILLTVLVAALAYLIGCFSTGTIISNAQGVNIRNEGSKNTGASNVLRVLGLKSGLICFLGDFFKAVLACWLGSIILPGSTFGIARFGTLLAGLMVIIGHNWPVFYGFKGGKGVACSVAVIFYVDPLWGIISIVLCVSVIAITRFISLGSMTMLLSYMILMCIAHWGEWFTCLFTVILFVLCVIRHRSNIGRLLNGTENKIGQKVKPNQQTEESK